MKNILWSAELKNWWDVDAQNPSRISLSVLFWDEKELKTTLENGVRYDQCLNRPRLKLQGTQGK
jgi:hypothetical protein